MAYNEVLADRITTRLAPRGVTAKKMFAGLTFLWQDNALLNLYDEGLMVRVGPDGMDRALARRGAKPLPSRGKPANGWVLVAEKSLHGDALDYWLDSAWAFVAELPPKKRKTTAKK
ncbi:TfoX/Sxy family protein [Nocardia sp. NPDC052566]|uniref:TfoX/Sxy family protein n=1 Tax=Nocardia sp. NPDC052566 TaxID=3364330 RepID=UPI0037CC71C7